MKLSVAQKEPTSYRDLIKKVTEVWLMETSKEACEKLVPVLQLNNVLNQQKILIFKLSPIHRKKIKALFD